MASSPTCLSWRSAPWRPRPSGPGPSWARLVPIPPRRPGTRASGGSARGSAVRHPSRAGLVIAVPVVAVFVILFASADAVFARLTSDVLAWKPDLDLGDLAFRTVVVGVVAWTSAGLLGLASGLLPGYVPASPAPRGGPGRPGPGRLAPGRHRADRRTPAAPLRRSTRRLGRGGIDRLRPSRLRPAGRASARRPRPRSRRRASGSPGVATWPTAPAWPARARRSGPRCASGPPRPPRSSSSSTSCSPRFVALQLAYLFGGRDTMAMAGLTYAEYARRGFFELVLVALLAGTLVVDAGPRGGVAIAGPARGGARPAGAHGRRARLRARPPPPLPGRLRLDGAAVRGPRRRSAGWASRSRGGGPARRPADPLDAPRARDPGPRHAGRR